MMLSFWDNIHQNLHRLMLDIVILPHLFESDFYSSHRCCMNNCCVAFLQQWVLLSLDYSSTRSEENGSWGSLHGIHARWARTGTTLSAMSSTWKPRFSLGPGLAMIAEVWHRFHLIGEKTKDGDMQAALQLVSKAGYRKLGTAAMASQPNIRRLEMRISDSDKWMRAEALTSLRKIVILVTYMHLTASKEVVLCSAEQMLCLLAENLRHFCCYIRWGWWK